eukprot:jgi/Tetstr1/443508/TSEL_031512.t1
MTTAAFSGPSPGAKATQDPATPAPVAGQAGRAVSRPASPPGGSQPAPQYLSSAGQAACRPEAVRSPPGRPALSVTLPLLDITNAGAGSSASHAGATACTPPPGLLPPAAASGGRTKHRRSYTGASGAPGSSGAPSSSRGSSAGSSPRSERASAPPPTPVPGGEACPPEASASAGDVSPRTRALEGLAELGIQVDGWEQSDQFYMYVYKVMLCPKKYSHEWSACPFAHKGERATRRDPRHIAYSATNCPDFKAGPCPRGDHCPYSHGVFEACLHPERYRTQLCNSGRNCRRSVCFFAHSLPELRTPTCQPVAPQPQQPAPAAAASQPDLIAQLLALRGCPVVAPQQPTQEDLLRAQVLQYQQTLGLMSSLMSGAGGGQPGANPAPGLLELLAQLQLSQQPQPQQQAQRQQQQQYHHALPVMTESSRFPSSMPAPRKASQYDVEQLVADCEAHGKLANLSPRTPFDGGMISPARTGNASSPPEALLAAYSTPAAPGSPDYCLFPEDGSPEDRLPAHLMENL